MLFQRVITDMMHILSTSFWSISSGSSAYFSSSENAVCQLHQACVKSSTATPDLWLQSWQHGDLPWLVRMRQETRGPSSVLRHLSIKHREEIKGDEMSEIRALPRCCRTTWEGVSPGFPGINGQLPGGCGCLWSVGARVFQTEEASVMHTESTWGFNPWQWLRDRVQRNPTPVFTRQTEAFAHVVSRTQAAADKRAGALHPWCRLLLREPIELGVATLLAKNSEDRDFSMFSSLCLWSGRYRVLRAIVFSAWMILFMMP